MAQILNITCECGFNKTITVGEGLLAINKNYIRSTFTEEELMGFEEAIKNNTLPDHPNGYAHGGKLAYCGFCQDLKIVPYLRYIVNNVENYVIKPCPDCGKTVNPREEPGNCPKCGEILLYRNEGFSD
jgi:predicted RNA-binding Zn-ribbon protein involved in translation (DUF1610 family)